MVHQRVTERTIASAIQVHKALGPGLLESAYEECLAHELLNRGLRVTRQVDVPVIYDGHRLDCGFRIDILVDGKVIIELKAVEKLRPVHEAQLMTYLRLSGKPVGLLINFNEVRLKDGIIRRVL
ncbi:MAG: GxxExxY protein [Planctomycetota bacterium]